MRAPILTLIGTELLSMSQIQKRFGIGVSTLLGMHRTGGITEKRIRRHLKEREEWEALKSAMRMSGVSESLRRMRISRGWDEQEAATVPVKRRAA